MPRSKESRSSAASDVKKRQSQDQVQSDQDKSKEQQQQQQDGKEFEPKTPDQNDVEKVNQNEKEEKK
ncbi:hypothetical protein K3F94_08890 [Acinetobacter baumannii]|nr:hypothetical protein [Acinetobacter baumannii]